jgi:chromosome partitioning protein
VRIITIINQKGGCGKTTTAINLGASLARRGLRTLLVDMDPQSHCAAGLGIPEQRIDLDIGDAMLSSTTRELDASRLIWRVGRHLDLLPSRTKVAGLEAARGGLADKPDKERRLASVLSRVGVEYDVCLIDCSPTIGLLTFNALAAANIVLIPVETGYFSLQGATKQYNTVKTLSKRLGLTLPVRMLATMHDELSAVAVDLLGELNRRFESLVIPIVIRRDPRIREAASFGQPIIDHAPDSTGSADYSALADWFLPHLVAKPGAAARASGLLTPDADPPELVATPLPRATMVAAAATKPEPKPEPRSETELPSRSAPPIGADLAAALRSALIEAPAGLTRPQPRDIEPKPERRVADDVVQALGHAASVVDRAQRFLGRSDIPPSVPLRLEEPERGGITEPPASLRSILGVRQTTQGMLFVQPLSLGAKISIAGEFNGWSTTSHVMRRNETLGVFELCATLPTGRYLYRLVVDGAWVADPHNPATEPNPFGETNSILTVREQAGASAARPSYDDAVVALST